MMALLLTLFWLWWQPPATGKPNVAAPRVSAITCNVTLNNPSVSTIQTNVNSQSDGGVICVTGNVTGSGTVSLNNRNGITVICQATGCAFPASSGFAIDSIPSTRTGLYRISGFTWTNASGFNIWFFGNNDLQQVRIDHNAFVSNTTPGQNLIFFGEVSSTGKIYGVVDHNTASGTDNSMLLKNISGGTTSSAWETNNTGTSHNLYFEDNVCNFTNYSESGTGCIDVWRANGTVMRFNDVTNSRFVNHAYCHEGPSNVEIYLNTIVNVGAPTLPADYRNIHMQGSGEALVWGNSVRDNNGNGIVLQHFRADSATATSEGNCNSVANGTVTGSGTNSSNANDGNRSPTATYRGYPTWHQPGRDKDGTLKPLYFWLNQTPGSVRVDPSVELPNASWTGLQANCADTDSGRVNCHIQKDRDIYWAPTLTLQTSSTSPFNGSSGVGMGTLANRPTNCTANAESADAGNGGVGYWATDQGSWNTSTSNSHGPQVSGADGVLYRCDSTNHWVVAYTPYTYPHPLVTAGGG